MQHLFRAVLWGTTVLSVLPIAAQAQASTDNSVQEFVVTARRSSERLQDVPQTVTAISGEAIKKLNLTQFQDISSLTPGLTLNNSGVRSGRSPAPSIRGLTYDSSTQASGTVQIYQNDVPVSSASAFSAIYDIAGIEVLRGPQGTLRGRVAPSGAITIATARASLSEFGGYASGTASDRKAYNAQGAVSAPLIADVLAIRFAALVDRNQADQVTSLNSTMKPYNKTNSARATVRYQPTDALEATASYQYMWNRRALFAHLAGPGAPGGTARLATPNYNGPPLRPSDRKDVDDAPRLTGLESHFATANVRWDVAGHVLNYIGGYTQGDTFTHATMDFGNWSPGFADGQDQEGESKSVTHEFRVASSGDQRVDYSFGYFYSKDESRTTGSQRSSFLPGSVGPPNAPNPFIYDRRYVLRSLLNIENSRSENSFYGNLIWNIRPQTELTVGARHIISSVDDRQLIYLSGGLSAQALSASACAARGGVLGATYAGYCDVRVPPGVNPVTNSTRDATARPTVWNVALKHRFSPDLLVYGNVGTAWRLGAVNIALRNAENDPVLASYNYLPAETSISYEVGVKASLFDRRLRLNASLFRQDFDGLLFQQISIPYLSSDGATTTVAAGANFNVGADSIISGGEFDAAFQITRNWTMSFAGSYADGRVDGQLLPCRDANFDGAPDNGVPTVADYRSRGLFLTRCVSTSSVSRDPLWNANLQSEYQRPVGDLIGYMRGLLNYYPENSRANAGYVVPSYALLNLYAGVRAPDGAWDIGVFARNVGNTGVATTLDLAGVAPPTAAAASFGSPGYSFTSYTPPREVGVTLRYAFGSR